MDVNIISYNDIVKRDLTALSNLESALSEKGIVGIKYIPEYEKKVQSYLNAAKTFFALDLETKLKYAPNRDKNSEVGGFEIAAEWFKDENNNWQIDDKKASYYAIIPNVTQNKWPSEIAIKEPYLDLGNLVLKTCKLILNALGINQSLGINHHALIGYGRMLHYQKENQHTIKNPLWCGAHFDHGVLTGLLPAFYFKDGVEIDEPIDAGLFITPTNGHGFEKIHANDKSILYFQTGEFCQLASNDKIKATRHLVKKAKGNIERLTFALFCTPDFNNTNVEIQSTSRLTSDERYVKNKKPSGSVSYKDWHLSSLERYLAK